MASTPVPENASSHHRLRNLLKPDGRRVHIAGSPEEHVRLRRNLSTIEPDGEFDVYIHGSDEHVGKYDGLFSGRQVLTLSQLEVVREIHAHHEKKRRELREAHGTLYEEFENIYNQLNVLSHELHLLTEHGVALDANFSKYGYSAHLSKSAIGCMWLKSRL